MNKYRIPHLAYILFNKDDIAGEQALVECQTKEKHPKDWQRVAHKRVYGHFQTLIAKELEHRGVRQLYCDPVDKKPDQEILNYFKELPIGLVSLLTDYFNKQISYEILVEKSPVSESSLDTIFQRIFKFKAQSQ